MTRAHLDNHLFAVQSRANRCAIARDFVEVAHFVPWIRDVQCHGLPREVMGTNWM
jgi:hypothetical protein